MEKIRRFSISIDKELLKKFDRYLRKKKYPTRSKAIENLMRSALVEEEWLEGKEVAGSIVLVYNHHKRELVAKLTDIEHDFHNIILSSQHIHLDHENCLEIIAIKGTPSEIEELRNRLGATKGVKHCSLTMATTGREV
jgi:CopG family nickel-responsive transcriptional regulator